MINKNNNVLSFRADEEIDNILDKISEKTGIAKSKIIKTAILRLLIEEELPEELQMEQKLIKAKAIRDKIKTIRKINHMINDAKKWISYIDNLNNGKITHPPESQEYNILTIMNRETRDKIYELEKQLLQLLGE